MKRLEALELLKEYYERPVFSVKIGICSPQIENVTFEEALEEFDRCSKWRSRELMEYLYIFVPDYLKEAVELNDALSLFDLGRYNG